ncbi:MULTISPECIES: hypothetical protein [Parageobacillus]|jgi:hypothetical protein|uniref:Uncharacterized protein n=1 Tax=Parageobacillus thermoglucosidasius TaxID=1426 RepID=A0A1B7KM90_PARTM|nr:MULTISPECIES: hypothetical protein [Parageobacillus]OAT71198.1 hypothetical protein A7K69_15530 [Parageobacillus thermoglucosidasius]BDG47434.1 hypothetical protein PspKH34_19950 [Parageobacillus sp. KH3-4]
MKKYMIFLVSFVLLFSLTQMLSGILLTATYNPDLSETRNISANLPQEVVFGESSAVPTLILAVLSATIAYFIPKILKN